MPADTFSTDLGFLQMGTGNDNNTWGVNANTSVFQIFADAIANALSNSVAGGTLDLSTSPPPAAPSQVRYAGLIFTGLLGSAQTIKVPNLNKWWLVQNATSGAFTLTFSTPAPSTTGVIPQNSGWQMVYCDGANNILVWPFNTNQVQMPDGNATRPSYSGVFEINSGWYRHGAGNWRFSIGGGDVLEINGAGVVVDTGNLTVTNGNAVVTSGNVVLNNGSVSLPLLAVDPAAPASGKALLFLDVDEKLTFIGGDAPYNVRQTVGVPISAVLIYTSPFLPDGFLWCDGSAISRTTYVNLFEIVGTTFGMGDGVTTFNVPNFQDVFPTGTVAQIGIGTIGTIEPNGYLSPTATPVINAIRMNFIIKY